MKIVFLHFTVTVGSSIMSTTRTHLMWFLFVVEWIVLSAFSNMLTKFLQSMAKYYLNGLHLKHQILFKNKYFFLKIQTSLNIEHKLPMNNQVSDTTSGEPLFLFHRCNIVGAWVNQNEIYEIVYPANMLWYWKKLRTCICCSLTNICNVYIIDYKCHKKRATPTVTPSCPIISTG